MAAMTVEETTRVSANNKEQMATLLDQQQEARTWRDRIASAPKALKGWANSMFEWMRLSKAKDGFISVWNRGRELFVKVFGPIRKIGLLNILGALLTCKGGRDILRAVGRTTYRVVSAPVRLAGRMLGWVGRHIGLTKAVDWVDRQYHAGVDWCAAKLDKAVTWLDEREHSGAMRWTRVFFQGAILHRAIRHFAPDNLRGPLNIAALFVPVFGVGKKDSSGLGTESKLEVVKDAAEKAKSEVGDKVAKATEKDASNVTVMPKSGPVEVIEKFEGLIVGTGKKTHYQRVTKQDGSVVYRWQGRDYSEAEIPQHIKITVAAAETIPEPPDLNRAAKRAEAKAEAKSGSAS